jgi:hypothetical protein
MAETLGLKTGGEVGLKSETRQVVIESIISDTDADAVLPPNLKVAGLKIPAILLGVF